MSTLTESSHAANCVCVVCLAARPGITPLERLSPGERRALLVLADDWYRCDADGRALICATASKLAR